MLMLAGLIVVLMVLAFVWDLMGQPTPRRWLRRMRHRRDRRGLP